MILYTWQGYNLREFRGMINPAKSSFAKCPNVKAAKEKLSQILGEDQLIHFSQEPPDTKHLQGKYVHQIDVEERDIHAMISGFIWHHIIGETCYIPQEEQEKIKSKLSQSPDEDYFAAEKRLRTEFLSNNLPGDLWSSIQIDTLCFKCDEVLVKHPMKYSRIIEVKKI